MKDGGELSDEERRFLANLRNLEKYGMVPKNLRPTELTVIPRALAPSAYNIFGANLPL